MKKTLLISLIVLLFLFLSLGVFGWIAWERRASVAAYFLERALHAPVSIQSLDFQKGEAQIQNLFIGNPKGFRSPSSFTAQSIEIDTTWKELRGNPLTIDLIDMANLQITIEQNAKGTTNWDRILEEKPSSSRSSRHWLIKTLILRNLSVRVIKADGTVKNYPVLARLEFHNISDETGFPVDAIEKAIFNEVMKNLFKNLDLQKLLQPLIPGGQYLPSLPGLF